MASRIILNTLSASADTPLEEGNSPSLKGCQQNVDGVVSPSLKGCQQNVDGVVSPSLKGCQVKPDGVVHWKNLPFNPELKEKAKELRKAGNLSEVLFWQTVKNKQFLGLDFDRQKIIGNYIVDFFCKNLGFVVEIDGQSHDLKGAYDEKRDRYLDSLGLKIFHIKDEEIRKNLDGVIKWLKQEILNTPSASADIPLKERNSPSMKGCQAKPDGVVSPSS